MKSVLQYLLLAVFLVLGFNANASAANAKVKHATKQHAINKQDVLAEIKKRYPATVVTSIQESGIDGIYEVIMGTNVAYVDSKVNYFLFGHIFDMQTQKDITQDRLDEANKIDFEKLPLDKAVKIVKGNGSRAFAVFTDPDCPYCKQLEKVVGSIDNYTMYVFMFPIPQLHPAATDHANGVWCAKDRADAWSKSMASGIFPDVPKDCVTPTNEVQILGSSLGVQGTPTLFRADGKRMGGAMPPEAINKWLDGK